MSLKKDLSIDFLGVKCENPFFLSSSPVGSNYEMCAKERLKRVKCNNG